MSLQFSCTMIDMWMWGAHCTALGDRVVHTLRDWLFLCIFATLFLCSTPCQNG